MAQAGLHGLVGMAVKKMAGKKEWLLLGILLGSFIPDMDNLGVAVATVAKMPIAEGVGGIHRTLTHSVFFAVAVIAVFYFIGQAKKETRWLNLGLGLGLGIFLHSLLDLVLWFNGVALFWPIPIWINLWSNFPAPGWYDFMEPAEFLFFGLFLWALGGWARKFSTDGDCIHGRLGIRDASQDHLRGGIPVLALHDVHCDHTHEEDGGSRGLNLDKKNGTRAGLAGPVF
jgi:membrane-bound metal-dependent hydrolase YbcI (DUF457 family)